MIEDNITKIQEVDATHWILASTDEYVIKQYKEICSAEGLTDLEVCGIFDTRKKIENILSRIHERRLLWGQDPHNRVG